MSQWTLSMRIPQLPPLDDTNQLPLATILLTPTFSASVFYFVPHTLLPLMSVPPGPAHSFSFSQVHGASFKKLSH